MADSNPTFGLLFESQIYAIKRFLISNTVQGILMGSVSLLAFSAIYTLCRRGLRSSIARRILLIAVLMVFVSSAVICSCTLGSDINAISWFGENPVPAIAISRWSVGMAIGSRINYLINDLIVVWRAWVLSEIRAHRISLAICSVILIGCELAEAVLTVEGSFTRIQDNGKNKILDLLLFVPLLTTNILATCIIAHKTWSYRNKIKVHFEQQGRQTRVEKILVLLIESGVIYCVLWTIILLTALGTFSDMATEVIASVTPYTAAIYPMAIILLVSHGKTTDPTSIGAAPTQSLHFASSPRHHFSHNTHTRSIIQSLSDHLHYGRPDEESSIDSASGTEPVDGQSKELIESPKA